MKWLIPISLAVLGGTAHADQCQSLDEAQARKALSIVANAPRVIDFCEPCGDRAPGVPKVARHLEVRKDGGYHELAIDGRAVDLAYTYVQTSQRQYANLAALAGCEAHGVSPTLSIESETPTGVLITASDAPVPALAPPPRAAPARVAPPDRVTSAARPATPTVYVYATTTAPVPWLVLALAIGGGALSGAMLALIVLTARRRRTMRPRALDLR